MDIPQHYVTSNEYRFIKENSIKIAKNFGGRGLNDIRIDSMTLIEENVIIRGDLGKIQIGPGTILDKNVVLRPCITNPMVPNARIEYKHLQMGANCYIGKNSIVCARSIGSCVYVGEHSIIGDRAEIGSNVKILPHTVIACDTKIPDNCVYGGKPPRYLGEITEGFGQYMEDLCSNYYINVIFTN